MTDVPAWTTLTYLRAGETGVIKAVHGEGPTYRRLRDLGLQPGVRIQLAMASLSGDPRAYRVGTSLITLSNEHARLVELDITVPRR